jgi:LAS superfamily LD-carboxypeptidase LdcB
MQMWGQNKQKVKVRSIFPTYDKANFGNLVNQKISTQIQDARNKIRTNLNHTEKVDESVLAFRKSNEISDQEQQPTVNLNPLILYEKNELRVIDIPNIANNENSEKKIEDATLSYQKFKEQNLTKKYKLRKRKAFFYRIIAFLLLIGIFSGLSYFNFKRLETECNDLQKLSQKIGLESKQDCKYEIKENWWNFGYNSSEQVKLLKNRIADLEFGKQQEGNSLRSKISALNTLLNKKEINSSGDLDENKSRLAILVEEKATKIIEFGDLLNKAKYLDEVLNGKKGFQELSYFEKFSDSEKIQAIEVLKKRINDISKNNDSKKIDELLKYKYFEGDEWKNTYEQAKINYENIKSDLLTMDYFGDPKANAVAVEIAEKRGFTKRMLVKDESQLYNYEGQKLQKPILDALSELFKEMRAEKLKITLISGFRGIEEQAQIFGDEFKNASKVQNGKDFTLQEIIDRKADDSIAKALETVALPGYSRHHFGYTVDIAEDGTDYKQFETTKSYEWMSKNNFLNTKKYGIIPSYPKGVNNQGPEPESWEFVYVGTTRLSAP